MATSPLKLESIQDIKTVLSKMSSGLKALEEDIDQYDLLYSYDKEENVIETTGLNFALRRTKDLCLRFLVEKAKEAIIQTEEFNFGSFPKILEDAIIQNADIFISYKYNPTAEIEIANCKVDLSKLGDLYSWLNIVNSAYPTALSRGKAIGKGALEKYPEDFGPDKDLADRFWRSKYYAAGRENKKIIRKRKQKPHEALYVDNRMVVPERSEWGAGKDSTAHYIKKYVFTMEKRAALIPSGKAPFWYILEYGTEPGAYPSYKGTHFIEKTEIAIKNAFEEILRDCLKEAREMYKEILWKQRARADRQRRDDFGEQAAEERRKRVSEMAEDNSAYLIKIFLDNVDYYKEARTGSIVSEIKSEERYWIVKTKGGFGRRFNIAQYSRLYGRGKK